jgi:Holliday junction resolvase RusA-like endonuclease
MQNEIELKEFDLIMPKKKEWNQEAKELRTDLVNLLKNIEDDQYEEGLEKINGVIGKLQDWKNKIQKFL